MSADELESIRRRLRGRGYDLSSLAIIAVFLFLLWRIRASLPVFSDSWYHLGVIRAFAERGISLDAWWEFAPFGRPHLYPPLFHLAGVAMRQLTGADWLGIARGFEVVTFPLVLAAGWGAARSWFGARAAWLTLLLLAINFGLVFPCSLILMPGTYAVLAWPFMLRLLLRKKWFWAGLLLAVMGYLHFGVAGVAVVSLILLALFRREFLMPGLFALLAAGALFSPWLAHLGRHREFLQSGVARLPIFIPVFTLIAAGIGAVSARRNPTNESRAVLCMILASALFLFTLTERFWTYGGFLFAILGGYGLDRWPAARVRVAMAVLVVSALSVTPFLKPARMRLAVPIPLAEARWIMAAPFLAFANWPRTEAVSADLAALGQWITEHVDRDEVLLTDDRLLGASLFVLTGRRTTSGLWSEIMTAELKEKLAHHYRTASGYIVVDRDKSDPASLAGQATFVVAFGKYAVYHRADSWN